MKSHEIKNVTDFNVADSVRRDVKVLVTKTRYTVFDKCLYSQEFNLESREIVVIELLVT